MTAMQATITGVREACRDLDIPAEAIYAESIRRCARDPRTPRAWLDQAAEITECRANLAPDDPDATAEFLARAAGLFGEGRA